MVLGDNRPACNRAGATSLKNRSTSFPRLTAPLQRVGFALTDGEQFQARVFADHLQRHFRGAAEDSLMLPAVRRFVPHDVVFRPAFRHLEAKPFHLGIPNRERLAGRLRVPHNALGQHVLSLPRDPLFRKLSHQQRVAAITHLPGSSEGTRRATKAAFVGAKATSRRSSSGTCGSSGST